MERAGGRAVAAGAALLCVAAAGATPAPRGPMFPAPARGTSGSTRLPVAANSATIVRSIGLDAASMRTSAPGSTTARASASRTSSSRGDDAEGRASSFEYADESDKGPVPDPPSVPIEGDPNRDGDRHALIVDRDTCTLYELYALHRTGTGWAAGSGAIWSLRSNKLRPAGWTSADAAGLPILPGLARYDEVAAGAIDHALRFTAQRTRRAYIYPARHFASDSTDPSLPPMGLRVRLKASFDTRGFPPQARIVLEALKRYGMILADNGSPWYISGAPDPRWSNDDLHALGRLTGADFEVVDTSRLRP